MLLPKAIAFYSHKFITWIAIPILVLTSVDYQELYTNFWLAPLIAIIAVLVSAAISLIAIDLDKIDEKIRLLLRSHKFSNISGVNLGINHHQGTSTSHSHTHSHKKLVHTLWTENMQDSFLASSLIGNTNYIAFAIISLIVISSNTKDSLTYPILFDISSYILGIFIFILFVQTRENQKRTQGQNITQELTKAFNKTKLHLLNNQVFVNIIVCFLIGTVISFGVSFNGNNQGFFQEKLQGLVNITITIKTLIVYLYLIGLGTQFSTNKYKFAFKSIFMFLISKALIVPIMIGALLIMMEINPLLMLPLLIQVAMPPKLLDPQLSKDYKLLPEFINSVSSVGAITVMFVVPIWVSLYYL
ncbi:MAG: hypothetical protein NW214_12440 [Pseudanabaenaceae cyanobacterium bins.39]|nr:hypothetical protein [Pseudanabaenaceae cyanobacterium bins.39]